MQERGKTLLLPDFEGEERYFKEFFVTVESHGYGHNSGCYFVVKGLARGMYHSFCLYTIKILYDPEEALGYKEMLDKKLATEGTLHV